MFFRNPLFKLILLTGAVVALAPAIPALGAKVETHAQAVPPTVVQAEPKIEYTTFTLDNGLRVYVIEDHSTPTVAVVTYYRVGSKDEKPGKTGFAHLFEHMMFKGSAHVADGQMDLAFEEAGGWTNAFTSTDQTVYQDMS